MAIISRQSKAASTMWLQRSSVCFYSICQLQACSYLQGGQLANLPPGYYTSLNFIGTVAAFSLANMSNYAGYVMTFNLLGIINEDLGPSDTYVWVATGYTLAAVVGALLWGRLSDVFGRRWFFVGGNACAFLGSILGAVAQNIVTLVFGQVFIGLALASQLSFSIGLAELIPNKWRGYNNALLFFMAVPFSTFGPIIARNFEAYTTQTWRWSYYINLIISGLAIILAVVFYHPPIFEQLHTRASKRQVLKDMDYLGILLFVGGLILFLLGLSWGGQVYPWKSAHTLATLLIGVALLVGFFLWGRCFLGELAIGWLIRLSVRALRRQRSFVATTLS